MSEKTIDKFRNELEAYIDFDLLDCLNNDFGSSEKEYQVYLADLKEDCLRTEPKQSAVILRELSETQFKIYDTLASKWSWNPYLEVVFGVLSKKDTKNYYLSVNEFIPRPSFLDYSSLPVERAIETRSLTLGQYVESFGCLSEKEALVFLYQLCEAVSILHQEDFIHGDISPCNILLTDRFSWENDFDRFSGIHQKISVKLIDFDITKSVEISNHTITSAVGTFPYAAPEIIDFKNPTDRADMYSLGCIFCFMLTGKSPKDAGWNEIAGNWNKEIYRIFADCTANYEFRYASPSELKKDIRRLLCYPDNCFCKIIKKIPGFRDRNPIKMVLFLHSFGIYRIGISAFEEIVPDPSELVLFSMIFYVLFILMWFDVFDYGWKYPEWHHLKKLSPVMAFFIKLTLIAILGGMFVLAIYLS